MNCTTVQAILDKWIDGELSKADTQQVSLHLANCQACSTAAAEQAALGDMLEQLPAPELSRSVTERTMQAFHAEVAEESYADWWKQLGGWMRGATCSLAVCGILMGLLLGSNLSVTSSNVSATDQYILLLEEGEGVSL